MNGAKDEYPRNLDRHLYIGVVLGCVLCSFPCWRRMSLSKISGKISRIVEPPGTSNSAAAFFIDSTVHLATVNSGPKQGALATSLPPYD